MLAGDHAKAASDLGLPLVGVSLLYRQGYLQQRLTHDGWQLDVTPVLEPGSEPITPVLGPEGEPLCVEIFLNDPDSPVRLQIWCVQVGRVSLYLLDADVEGNPDWTRTVSSRLYGGDQEHRLRQEKILGIGGVRALRAMGVDPVYWHGNEGHAGFHLLESSRVGSGGPDIRRGIGARHRIVGLHLAHPGTRRSRRLPAASHRPLLQLLLAAARVDPPRVPRAWTSRCQRRGIQHDRDLDAPLRFPQWVSARHGEITRAMWHDLWPDVEPLTPITSITNGVHLPTWISPPAASAPDRLFAQGLAGAHAGGRRLDAGSRHS